MRAPAKRILYVEGNVDGTIGGSYYSLFYLVAGLDRKRYEPIVVFSTDNALIPRFNSHGVRTIVRRPPQPTIMSGGLGRLTAKSVNFCRGWILEPCRLASLLRTERVSLVHLNNSIVRNHPWMIAARLARIPCITHERGINSKFPGRARLLARRLDAVICISQAVRDNFAARGLGDLNLVTIHNGLDPAEMRVTRPAADIRRELAVPATARMIGIVGNIKPWKGQEVVIRAMSLLKDRYPDVVCLLIGDTSPEDAAFRTHILRLIEESGLTNRVLVTGFRSDIANYINALEIQIHASVNPEPFGRVLLEAMALAKPLIASDAGAVPEIVIDGETGILFDPSRADTLADHIDELLSSPARARMLGDNGRLRLAAEFSTAHNIQQTQSTYDKLIGAKD